MKDDSPTDGERELLRDRQKLLVPLVFTCGVFSGSIFTLVAATMDLPGVWWSPVLLAIVMGFSFWWRQRR